MNNYVDHYEAFYRTFLTEMPQIVSSNNNFPNMLIALHENLQYVKNVKQIEPTVFKIESDVQATYWVGNDDASAVSIIVDTDLDGHYCRITGTAKNPEIPIGVAPYASDLYVIICQDAKPRHPIFTSDKIISTDAERLWLGLLKRGNTISVYDTSIKQYVLNSVTSKDELLNYVGDLDKQRYIFVLSTSIAESRGIIHSVAIMEIKRLSNWPLFESIRKINE